jgi:hypothetical protein
MRVAGATLFILTAMLCWPGAAGAVTVAVKDEVEFEAATINQNASSIVLTADIRISDIFGWINAQGIVLQRDTVIQGDNATLRHLDLQMIVKRIELGTQGPTLTFQARGAAPRCPAQPSPAQQLDGSQPKAQGPRP